MNCFPGAMRAAALSLSLSLSLLAGAGVLTPAASSGAEKVIITEIHYNPHGPDEEREFVELKNVGDRTADMSGWQFTKGILHTFPQGTMLAPGDLYVIVANAAKFGANYPGVTIGGQYIDDDDMALPGEPGLSKTGERLTLKDGPDETGATIFTVEYWDGKALPDPPALPTEEDLDRAPWPTSPDGNDYTLATLDPNGNPDPDDYRNWRPSINFNGSPGANEPLPSPLNMIYVNEIRSRDDAANNDAVELRNPGATAVDVSDWFVSDNMEGVEFGDDPPVDRRKKSPVPAGTVISADGYVVLENGVNGFLISISSKGERAFLYSADASGDLTGWVHGFHVEASDDGKNFGRFVNSADKEQLIADDPSLGAANGDPALPLVVITEVMYSPAYGASVEYLKIKNAGNAPALLYDPDASSDNMSVGGFGVTIPGVMPSLAAGEEAFVTNVDDAVFRAAYGVDPGARVFADDNGGGLSGGGELIELRFPITIDGMQRDAPGHPRYYAVGDEVCYDDDAPWPTDPSGRGFSLLKLDPRLPGFEPVNWGSSPHRGGTAYSGGIVLVNEILAHTDEPQTDVIELFNPGAIPVEIGGWYLSDEPLAQPGKYRIPDGATISAGGYWAVNEDDDFDPDTTPPSAYFGSAFSISSRGDSVYLFSGDGAGDTTGYAHGADFLATANGVSLIRFVDSAGHEGFPPQEGEPTVEIDALIPFPAGMANSGPRVELAVIGELLYAPGGADTEFIEITNISGSTLPLYDTTPIDLGGDPGNHWQLDGVTFTFPGVMPTIPEGGRAVILPRGESADDFRARYSVPGGVTIYGDDVGYIGALNNGGEEVQLLRPDKPDDVPGVGIVVPLIPVDALTYDNADPWPGRAGRSIERINEYLHGDEPRNWQTSTATAAVATPGVVNSGYAGWMTEQFTPDELRGPDIGPGDDFSGSGSINLEAYAFGFSPRGAADYSKFPRVTTTGSGVGETMALAVRQRIGAGDLIYRTQRSNDCRTWMFIHNPVGAPVDNGDGTETVLYADEAPIGADDSFMRAVVSKISP